MTDMIAHLYSWLAEVKTYKIVFILILFIDDYYFQVPAYHLVLEGMLLASIIYLLFRKSYRIQPVQELSEAVSLYYVLFATISENLPVCNTNIYVIGKRTAYFGMDTRAVSSRSRS